mgnify:CR=1 FL=1
MTILSKNIKITTIILLFLSLSLTSCFDIIQDLTVKENGSGKFALTVNLSKSKSQLEKILAQDYLYGFNIPSTRKIEEKLRTLKTEFTKLKGISNVQIQKDFNHYVFKLTFDFQHVNNINQAQIELAKLDPKIGQPITYSYSAKEFNCSYSKDLLKEADNQLIQYKLADLSSADLITIFRFDKQIKSCSNSTCKISKNGKTTFNKVTAPAFIGNTINHSVKITFN